MGLRPKLSSKLSDLHRADANHSVNRTFCGTRLLGFISFSPKPSLPQTAGKLKLQGLPRLSSGTERELIA